MEFDKNMPEAHLAMGWYYQSQYEWDKAETSFAKAIELTPKYSQAYLEYGMLLDVRRKFAKAEEQFQKAISLKPFDPFFYTSHCKHYYYDENWDDAIKACNEALDIDSKFNMADKNLFWIYVETDNYEAMLNSEYKDYSETEVEKHFLAKPLKDGNIELYWKRRIEDRLQNKSRRYSPFAIAGFYSQLRDKEKTLQYI